MDGMTNNEYHKAVATLIDRRITAAYHLWPNNYIAHDLLHGSTRHSNCYTPEEKQAFERRMQKLDRYDTCDIDQLKDIFLGIYANPVDSANASNGNNSL